MLASVECDFVVLVVPGSKDNFKVFTTAEFKAMKLKKTAILVNIRWGSVVDQEALACHLLVGDIHCSK